MKEARPGRVASTSSRGRGRSGRVARRPQGAEDDESSTRTTRVRRQSIGGDSDIRSSESSSSKSRTSSNGPPSTTSRRLSGGSVPPRLRDTNRTGSFNRKKSFENGKNLNLGMQIKNLSNKLFSNEKEKEFEDLICLSIPNDNNESSTVIKKLQVALEESLKSRKELVDSCISIERTLLMEATEAQALITQNNEQIDELNANIQSLTQNTTVAVNAVEKRWRACLDAEKERYRKYEEEMQKRVKEQDDETKQLLYANQSTERALIELSTKASTVEATQSSTVKSKDEEVDRLRAEVSRLTGVLESKSNEVSVAMVTFAEMQRMTVEREGELKAKLSSAEEKVEELSASLAEEKAAVFSVRQELMMATNESSTLQGRLSEMKNSSSGSNLAELADIKAKLAVETSLKERAEQREEAERMERVATNAQLIAVEQSKSKALEEARDTFTEREKKLVNEIAEYNDRIESLSVSMKEFRDSNERLEAEKRMLTRGLERMKVQNHHNHHDDMMSESDYDESAQSDYASPAQRRREMLKKKQANAAKGGGGGEDHQRGLWARMRNKKEKPLEIYQQKQKPRRLASHQAAEQLRRVQKRDSQSDEDDGGDDDGVFGEDELGAQIAASESYSDSEVVQQKVTKQRRGSQSANSPNSPSSPKADNSALLAAQAQIVQQAEAAVAQAQEMAELAGANEELKSRVADLEKKNQELRDLLATTKAECAASLVDLETKVREGETKRRKMHNLIQELRGNVRVFARVRPFLPGDKVKEPDPKPWLVVRADGVGLDVMNSIPTGKGSVMDEHPLYSFEYDRAFHPSQGQDVVFEEVSEFVQSALDGYNVCLFSYGQTGSGKTHTMQGVGSGAMRGIIPRAVQQVAEYKEKLEEQGWQYTMQVSFVEIYCEKIRDLLKGGGSGGKKKAPELEHKIIRNDYGSNEISNVNMVDVDPADKEAMAELMEIAASARATKKTDMNETSSRSHSVFTLHLKAINTKLNAHIAGQLNLCDLAGSERVDRSGATGVTLTEAKNINKSLAALAHVFESLSKQAAHVPFRDSTLTYLLEPSLSGNGKTLMIINLSPTESSVNESVSTLRFGAKVNKVELGKPKRQIGSGKSKEKDSKSAK